jgi:hypothetical protein
MIVPLLFCLSKKEAEPGRKKDNFATAGWAGEDGK